VKQTTSEFLMLGEEEKFMLIQRTRTKDIPTLDSSLNSPRLEIEIRVKFLDKIYSAFLVALDKDPFNATLRLCIGNTDNPEHPVIVIKDSVGVDSIKHWEDVKSFITPLIHAEARDNSGILEMDWKFPAGSYSLQFAVQKNAGEEDKTWGQIFSNQAGIHQGSGTLDTRAPINVTGTVLPLHRYQITDIAPSAEMLRLRKMSTDEIKKESAYAKFERQCSDIKIFYPSRVHSAFLVALSTDPYDSTLRLCIGGRMATEHPVIKIHISEAGTTITSNWKNVFREFPRNEKATVSINLDVLRLTVTLANDAQIVFDVQKNANEHRTWENIFEQNFSAE
jgi:hypothetical protein